MDETFLRDICEHPDDDAPRHVYADWLEERGDLRGAFIRVQCELAAMPEDDARRSELESRELSLIRQRSKGWAREIRGLAREWTFQRGFIHALCIDAATFIEHREGLYKLAPLRSLKFKKAAGRVDDLAECPELSRCESISLAHNVFAIWPPYGNAGLTERNKQLQRLLSSPHLQQIQSLDLRGCFMGNAALRVILKQELPHLTNLDLSGNVLTDDALARFASKIKGLRALRLSQIPMRWQNPSGFFNVRRSVRFCLSPLLDQLELLEIGRSGADLQGLESLSDAPASKLRSLGLRENNLQTTGLRSHSFAAIALSDLPMFRHLTHLDLSQCELHHKLLTPMLQTGRLRNLRSLDVSNNPLTAAGAEAIGTCRRLPALRRLQINGGGSSQYTAKDRQMGDRGFAALVESTTLFELAVLEARQNNLTAESVTSLLDSPNLQRFYFLDLSKNQLGDEGADLLAKHGPWPMLAYLNVRNNRLSKAAKQRLIKTFGYTVLV